MVELTSCDFSYTTVPKVPDEVRINAWFTERLPAAWTSPAPAHITIGCEEIHVILTLEEPTDHADEWLTDLRRAMENVERIRAAGPRPTERNCA